MSVNRATDGKCPVCDDVVWQLHAGHVAHHTLAEDERACLGCGGYSYRYFYGSTETVIGPHVVPDVLGTGAIEDPDPWELLKAAEADCRKLDQALVAGCRAAPDDAAPRLVLADWCAERGYNDWEAFWLRKAKELTEKAAYGTGPVGPGTVS